MTYAMTARFRFRGPHACPKLATEVFESGPELVSVNIYRKIMKSVVIA